jgi:heme-degrading monooxygenase HmoA
MVLEIAQLSIKTGKEDSFVAAYYQAKEHLEATDGFRSARMTRCIESSSRFVLLVEWESLESHTENFRNSERFPRWRELIGPFFDEDPEVIHTVDV